MSGGAYCDSKYTFVPKPAAPSYTVEVKPTASYTVEEKPTASYTIVDTPCIDIWGILTEHGILITEEDTRGLTVEGEL